MHARTEDRHSCLEKALLALKNLQNFEAVSQKKRSAFEFDFRDI